MDKRALLIDDDKAVREMFMMAFKKAGYSLDTVDSGAKGVALFRKQTYHLIFLDLKMPGMSGVETLKQLRAIDKEVPIYIITGFYDEYAESLKSLTASEGFAFELLIKPFGVVQILAIVNSVLSDP